jgi:hypothetical protein
MDAQFTANSSTVLASSTTDVQKISVATGAIIGAFSADANARGYLAVSADGATVATTVDGSTVNFYQSSDGALTGSFAASSGPSTPYLQFFQSTSQPLRLMVGTDAYNLDGSLWGHLRGAAGDSALPMQQVLNGRIFVLEGNAGAYQTLYELSASSPGAVFKTFDVSALNITPTALCGAFDRTRKAFAIAGNNGANTAGFVGLLDGTTGAVLGNVTTPYAGSRKCLAFSPVSDEFALVSQVGSSSTWRLESYKLNASKTGATLNWVNAVNSLSPITQVTAGVANASVTNTSIFVTGSNAPIASNPGTQVFNSRTALRNRTITETLLNGTRTRQMSVSTDGKYLAVVFNAGGNNLRVYNLQTGASLAYAGHVTGAAFFNATDMVVDGPDTLRVGASVAKVSTPVWGQRGFIIDPVVSPDGTKVAMMDAFSNEFVIFNTATGAATRYANSETIADFGWESDNDFWTLVRSNAGAGNSARVRVYTVGGTLVQKGDRSTSIALLPSGGFTGWQVAHAANGKWTAFVATRTDSGGAFVNTVRFWRWADLTQTEFELNIPGSVGGVKFTPDSSLLQIGTSEGGIYSLNVPAFPTAVSVNPTAVYGGTSTTGTVTISEPGHIGGTVVSLTCGSNLSVPATVVVPEGATSTTFTVKSTGVASPVVQTVTATANGRSVFTNVTVNAPVLKAVAFAAAGVEGGNPIDCTISIVGKAGPGGVTIPLTVQNTLTGSTSAVIAEGESFVVNTYTTKVRNVKGVGRIDATLNGSAKFDKIILYEPKVTDLTLSETTVVGGASLTGTVMISQSVPQAAGVTINVVSDSGAASVPVVIVPKNGTTKSFTITTTGVTHDTVVTISANTSDGTVKSKSFTITAPTIVGVSLDETSVPAQGSTSGTVTISHPAPEGGYLVDMGTDSGAATVEDVTIPAGETSTTFTVETTDVQDDTGVMISATHDASNAAANMTVLGRKVASVSLNSSPIVGGQSTTGTVTLNRAAPAGGFSVTMSSDISGVTVGDVTVAAGETTAEFTVNTVPLASDTTGSVTATHGTSAGASLTVTAPTVKGVGQSATSVTGGGSVTITITLNSAAPSGFTFNLSSNKVYATCPSSVTFAAGATKATFVVNTTTPPSSTVAKITVARGTFNVKKSITINP